MSKRNCRNLSQEGGILAMLDESIEVEANDDDSDDGPPKTLVISIQCNDSSLDDIDNASSDNDSTASDDSYSSRSDTKGLSNQNKDFLTLDDKSKTFPRSKSYEGKYDDFSATKSEIVQRLPNKSNNNKNSLKLELADFVSDHDDDSERCMESDASDSYYNPDNDSDELSQSCGNDSFLVGDDDDSTIDEILPARRIHRGNRDRRFSVKGSQAPNGVRGSTNLPVERNISPKINAISKESYSSADQMNDSQSTVTTISKFKKKSNPTETAALLALEQQIDQQQFDQCEDTTDYDDFVICKTIESDDDSDDSTDENLATVVWDTKANTSVTLDSIECNNSEELEIDEKPLDYVTVERSPSDKENRNRQTESPALTYLLADTKSSAHCNIEKTLTNAIATKTKDETWNQSSINDTVTNKKPSSKLENDVSTIRKRASQNVCVRPGNWILGAKIGSGAFGTVHVAMIANTGMLMAVKTIKMEKASMKDAKGEIEVLKSLSHGNIVRYYGAECVSKQLHIFQEWVPAGSITLMLQKFGPFPLPVIRSYLHQAIQGLAYLHEKNIMHRDIKGSNILVNDEGIVKLADFGASKRLSTLQKNMLMTLTMRGTPYFMAPEVFQEKYCLKADSWSIGCVAFQMATGSPPWKNLGYSNPVSLFNYIQTSDGPPPMALPSEGDMRKSPKDVKRIDLMRKLVRKCFSRNPSDRPSAKEMGNDSFFVECSLWNEADHFDSCRMFSPSILAAKKENVSPIKLEISPITNTSRRNSVGTSTSTTRSGFISPPLPRRFTPKIGASPVSFSPPLDTSEWPSWARNRHTTVEPPSQNLKLNLVQNMMGSLEISEDSHDSRRNGADESPTINTDSGSSLHGLDIEY